MKPLYAIRHKPTGHFLPEPKGRMGRGGSFLEPVDCGLDHDNPRLFKSELSAKRALTAWLQGKHEPEFGYECDDGYNSYRVLEGMTIIPVDSRRKSDMEIVSFRLILEEIP